VNQAGSSDPRRALVALCLTQVTGWGALYYAFPVPAPSITRTTGWSPEVVTGAFSMGLVVAAFVGIPVGRLVDRIGPRRVMTTGSAVAASALLLIGTAPDLGWFLTGWFVAGVAMGAVLYPPAFTTLTRLYGPGRVGALTTLTLVAGLASTVFAPLTAVLVERGGWHATYIALALVLAVVTIPGHAWGLRVTWPEPPAPSSVAQATTPGATARSRAFIALTTALTLATLVAFASVINLVPLMVDRGIDTSTAAWALGLGGVGQVLGRLGYGSFTTRVDVRTGTVVVLLATAASTALLGVLTSAAGLVLAAVLAGMARGVLTLLQATAVTDRWGAAHYGRLTSVMSAPIMAAVAVAPVAGAALAGLLDGYPASLLVLAAVAGLAALLSVASVPASHAQPIAHTARSSSWPTSAAYELQRAPKDVRDGRTPLACKGQETRLREQ
jgi:MFS family permease